MIRSILLSIILFLIGQISFSQQKNTTSAAPNDLTQFVNPFIGTGGHGHTYPGATMPFGMVQLSPDTRLEGWDGCSGYHFSDSYIYGFSHTHLSGTGVSDYGDILLMPTNEVVFNNGADGSKGYRAHFRHEDETATAGYYRVKLDSTDILVELTTTERAGMHRYTFPSAENQIVILDLEHRDRLLDFNITKRSNTSISGYRHSKAWAEDQRLFYYIEFSHPIENYTYQNFEDTGEAVKAALQFNNPSNEPIVVKVGISAVDEAGAERNMRMEIGKKSFDQVREEAIKAWNNQLLKIMIEESNTDRKTIFYTALYHTMLAPNLYQDVDGRYRGMDLKIHQSDAFNYYTVFSLWDTYRATHPLYTIIEQERTNDFVKTMLAKYEEGGIIPIWDLSANYTGCMIGYHGISVIADAYLKGIGDFDAEKALKAMKNSAEQNKLGLESYRNNGFIPVEEESESVSKTLEYAYDDWTIAQMAKKMGNSGTFETYIKRAQFYKNVFDPSTNFMRGRFRNTWFGPFDPYEVNFNYTEANAWQYSLYVPQDIAGHISLMGGKKAYENHLGELFTAKNETAGRHQADITGLIGQYAHGNEPSHHMAYLYNFINKPHKTQEKVHEILTTLYTNEPDGISGNEDCGQMSAWYIFSALGFYPVTPGSNQYIIGSPIISRATLQLENGNSFTIEAEGAVEGKKYIENVVLNGEALGRSYITHEELMNGGTLSFKMSDTPTDWATKDTEVPTTEIKDHLIVPAPFISKGEVAFQEKTSIQLAHVDTEAKIYYQWNDGEVLNYSNPLHIKTNGNLMVYAEKNGKRSELITTSFYKINPDIDIQLKSQYANEYSAGGEKALIDGIRGTRDFRTGAWQGYQNQDVVAIVDLGEEKTIDQISTAFLQDQRSWIFLPSEIKIEVSSDGKEWRSLSEKELAGANKDEEVRIEAVAITFSETQGRYVKLTAETIGKVPSWHLGYEYDGTAWIFIDELSID
ncbi:GH92 family glycosyl hydrolase [Luteirhabdus pelagi]|uniref:GH92 family glycosyl hydrolase n=1 Tax=Luteirhabdus pelagi TaxID=2792783 RepID=UPI00193953FD|nr:GH92 family glycosyl hydrolase [Luteirhabdus pelagi]